jgi:hypothetical protein
MEQSRHDMMSVTSEIRRAPICGVLSIAAPFIGAFLFWVLIWVLSDFSLSFVLALSLIPLSPICGVGFSIAAWIRRERCWLLPWIGLFINLALLCFVFINRNHMIGSFG